MQEFGRVLFNALLEGEARSLYYESKREATRQGRGLRLRLHIRAPRLAALPWEYLFDPRAPADYLCLSRNTPLVRYLDLAQPIEPLTVTPPLQILAMIASPTDLEPLRTERERERMSRALAPLEARGLVKLTWLEGQTWRDLQHYMRGGPWHVFHFIGHGGFDGRVEEGALALAGDNGRTELLHATSLGRLLANHGTLRLAILNACEGAKSGPRDLFSSTAATLAQRGIPAILAMQDAITDRAAIELTRAFYDSLADGLPVDAAVCEARTAISLGVTNSLEWGTPVLYLRAQDGVLFEMTGPPQALPVPISGPTYTVTAPPVAPAAAILQQQPPPPAVPQKTKEQWLAEGTAHRKAQRYQEAIAAFYQALQLDPNYADAYFQRGWALWRFQRHQQALIAYDRAIQLNPTIAAYYINKGLVFSDLERYEEALAAYEQAIQLDPKYATTHVNKGAALYKLERYEEALAAYEQAIHLEPNAIRYNNKADALFRLKRYEEALAVYEQAIQFDSTYAIAHNGKGLVLEYVERYLEALQAYEQAIVCNPNYGFAWRNKGDILSALGRTSEAEQAHRRARELGYQW